MKDNYTNKDFYLSGFLLASGCTLKDYTRKGGLTIFVFEDGERTQNLIKEYYSMTARVEPNTFGNALRTLKGIIHGNILQNQSDYRNAITNNFSGK